MTPRRHPLALRAQKEKAALGCAAFWNFRDTQGVAAQNYFG
jgi:hypothetical protein